MFHVRRRPNDSSAQAARRRKKKLSGGGSGAAGGSGLLANEQYEHSTHAAPSSDGNGFVRVERRRRRTPSSPPYCSVGIRWRQHWRSSNGRWSRLFLGQCGQCQCRHGRSNGALTLPRRTQSGWQRSAPHAATGQASLGHSRHSHRGRIRHRRPPHSRYSGWTERRRWRCRRHLTLWSRHPTASLRTRQNRRNGHAHALQSAR